MTINYITNLSLKENSGGGSGVNFATFGELKKWADVNYIGPISIPVNKMDHYISKLRRVAGLKGKYFFYSNDRLSRINTEVNNKLGNQTADINFFHGITPWIQVRSEIPYFAYTDACFKTYIDIYNNPDSFLESDKKRIFDIEAAWLSNATLIFFRSLWALNETKKAYGLNGDNFRVAGLGGFMEIPEFVNPDKKRKLLFISKEFIPKGGLICYKAFELVCKKYPDFRLTIIGDRPPESVLENPDVDYLGFLDKRNEKDFQIFKNELATSFLLIHPTSKDTNAMVLTEAGYFGCPSISVERFAIPEFVRNGETGFLVRDADNFEEIATLICRLIENTGEYQKFVLASRDFTTHNFRWDKVGGYIHDQILKNFR